MATTVRTVANFPSGLELIPPSAVRQAEERRISKKVEHNFTRTNQIQRDSPMQHLAERKPYSLHCNPCYKEVASLTIDEEMDIEISKKVDRQLNLQPQRTCDRHTGCSSPYTNEGHNDQCNECSQKQKHLTQGKNSDSHKANFILRQGGQEHHSLFKEKVDNWRSHKRDLPLRRRMIGKIVEILKIKKRSSIFSPGMSKKMPIMVKRLEMSLYLTAPSLQAYIDKSTLRQRLLDLAVPLSESSS
mmetsp:Transcript_33149/g.48600  ORF Transcript_33149/g.48600 Transcript_33149/m.48600 type:complete len:244 (-) Transcript_33149:175-906(-)